MNLSVQRKQLGNTLLTDADPLTLRAGQVLVKVDQFALTTNVITYSLSGESLKYFEFFPAGKEGYANVPAWGIGTVVATRHADVKQGERLYGFFTFAQYVVLEVTKARPESFVDLQPHRKDLSVIYNTYVRLDSGMDPFYAPGLDAEMMVFRPLFVTSWLLMDFALQAVADATSDNRADIYITSASSKTSYALAYLLSQRKREGAIAKDATIIGLTSPGNIAFTRSLGVYDEVVLYSDVAARRAPASGTKSLAIDMAGNKKVLTDILSFAPSCQMSLVGATHKHIERLPGKFFFAPAQGQLVVRRLGGDAKFYKALASDWQRFLAAASGGGWCRIERSCGPQNVERRFLEGRSQGFDPSKGLVLSMWPEEQTRGAQPARL